VERLLGKSKVTEVVEGERTDISVQPRDQGILGESEKNHSLKHTAIGACEGQKGKERTGDAPLNVTTGNRMRKRA